jgi:uncharacterized membrane protein
METLMKRTSKILLSVVLIGGAVGAVAAYAPKPFCHRSGGWHASSTAAAMRADWMADRIAARLDLNDRQKAKLDALKQQLLGLRESMQQQRGERRALVLGLLAAPTLDQQQILDRVQQKTAMVNDNAGPLVTALAVFTDSLDASQKATLRELVSERLGPPQHALKAER